MQVFFRGTLDVDKLCLPRKTTKVPSLLLWSIGGRILRAVLFPRVEIIQSTPSEEEYAGSEGVHPPKIPRVRDTSRYASRYITKEKTRNWNPNKVIITENYFLYSLAHSLGLVFPRNSM